MKKITKTKQVIGLILIIFVGLVVWDLFIVPDKSDLFFQLWRDDIRSLQQNKSLPAELKNIKTISVQPLNQKARNLIDGHRPPFNTNSKGNLNLDILIDVWQEDAELEDMVEAEETDTENVEQKEGVYIQYSLTSEDGNTIWELSRTILLPKSSSLISAWFPELFEENPEEAIQEDLMEDN